MLLTAETDRLFPLPPRAVPAREFGEFADLPNGVFDVIYADPPWEYSNGIMSSGSAAAGHYPTMSVDEMALLPVGAVAAPNSVLFMWATGPVLAEALMLGEAWGFAYSTIAFVWDKEMITPGYYTCASHELVLVFKRGQIPGERGSRNERQHIAWKRRGHSQKPPDIRERIQRMWPEAARLELFHRGERPDGWSTWGNESGE